MNRTIETLFAGFTVNNVQIPVAYMYYEGHGETYITYMQQDASASYSGDDGLAGYVDYYDIDIYSKSNIEAIISAVIGLMQGAGFDWQPSRTSPDLYEQDTGYYHKTLNFGILRGLS